jgi:hypothetical protein
MSAEGNLARVGDPHVAVDRLSAVHRGSESRFPINKDHSDLVKFSENDQDYYAVASYLTEIADSFASAAMVSSGETEVVAVTGDPEAKIGQ